MDSDRMRVKDFFTYYLWEVYCISRGTSKKETVLYKTVILSHLIGSLVFVIWSGFSLASSLMLYVISVFYGPVLCWLIHSWVFKRADRKVYERLQYFADSGRRPQATHWQMLEDAANELFNGWFDTVFKASLTGLAVLLFSYVAFAIVIVASALLPSGGF